MERKNGGAMERKNGGAMERKNIISAERAAQLAREYVQIEASGNLGPLTKENAEKYAMNSRPFEGALYYLGKKQREANARSDEQDKIKDGKFKEWEGKTEFLEIWDKTLSETQQFITENKLDDINDPQFFATLEKLEAKLQELSQFIEEGLKDNPGFTPDNINRIKRAFIFNMLNKSTLSKNILITQNFRNAMFKKGPLKERMKNEIKTTPSSPPNLKSLNSKRALYGKETMNALYMEQFEKEYRTYEPAILHDTYLVAQTMPENYKKVMEEKLNEVFKNKWNTDVNNFIERKQYSSLVSILSLSDPENRLKTYKENILTNLTSTPAGLKELKKHIKASKDNPEATQALNIVISQSKAPIANDVRKELAKNYEKLFPQPKPKKWQGLKNIKDRIIKSMRKSIPPSAANKPSKTGLFKVRDINILRSRNERKNKKNDIKVEGQPDPRKNMAPELERQNGTQPQPAIPKSQHASSVEQIAKEGALRLPNAAKAAGVDTKHEDNLTQEWKPSSPRNGGR